MCGLPFSGKTQVSKMLENFMPAVRISSDEIWVNSIKMQGDISSEVIRNICKNLIKDELIKGSIVVYDDTNSTLIMRDEITSIANSLGLLSCVLYLNISTNDLSKRIEQNKIDKFHHEVSDYELTKVKISFEVPTKLENLINYNF